MSNNRSREIKFYKIKTNLEKIAFWEKLAVINSYTFNHLKNHYTQI